VRLRAKWIQQNVPAGSLIAVENYGNRWCEDTLDTTWRPGSTGVPPAAACCRRRRRLTTRDVDRLRRKGVEYVVTATRARPCAGRATSTRRSSISTSS
jgi:hypothetical protein